jgi:site-specific DNA-methyltransferase (adenine-specific)
MNPDLIINADCMDIMKSIKDYSIDMILCDLPFGTTMNKWDIDIDTHRLWPEYRRIIKPNGAIVLFAQPPFDKILAVSNLADFRYEWIWAKESGTGHLNAHKMPMKIHENILVFYQALPTYNPQMTPGKPYTQKSGRGSSNYNQQIQVVTENTGYRYPTDILTFARDKNKLHPTQKPVALCEYLIRTYTNEGEMVLDNCCGSGTTLLAAKNTNRHYIGIEKDENYYNIAKDRVYNDKN